jgi:hypothetical protein
MKSGAPKAITKRDLRRLLANRSLIGIDDNPRMYHLPSGYWVYDEMLSALRNSGWVRFAPGFKAALFGKEGSRHCIKILGMGVGENPLYFVERGYYLEHERRMLERFRSAGFVFGPSVLSMEDSIRLLVDEGGVSIRQAELRVTHHDVLAMEYINGIPFATQTGQHINYDLEIVEFDQELLTDVLVALSRLRRELESANSAGLLHNDPMPPNIIFGLDNNESLRAWLVDFELAQDLAGPSPDYVNNSVAELYWERNVPLNVHTGKYVKNLDQHLINECIRVVREFIPIATKMRDVADSLEGVSVSVAIPFIAGISFNLGRFLKLLRRR